MYKDKEYRFPSGDYYFDDNVLWIVTSNRATSHLRSILEHKV